MLHAGLIHGDLSEFNVLMGEDGPVIIDFRGGRLALGRGMAENIIVKDG